MIVAPNYILLVEDNEDDVLFFSRSAAKAQVGPLRHVSDGEAAKQLLSTALPPSIIVTDLKMPHCDGFELIAWVRSKPGLKDIPIAVLSSSYLQKDKDRAYAAGASRYMLKPSNINGYEGLWELLRCLA